MVEDSCRQCAMEVYRHNAVVLDYQEHSARCLCFKCGQQYTDEDKYDLISKIEEDKHKRAKVEAEKARLKREHEMLLYKLEHMKQSIARSYNVLPTQMGDPRSEGFKTRPRLAESVGTPRDHRKRDKERRQQENVERLAKKIAKTEGVKARVAPSKRTQVEPTFDIFYPPMPVWPIRMLMLLLRRPLPKPFRTCERCRGIGSVRRDDFAYPCESCDMMGVVDA